ncbi:FtsX-like permease family protein [Eisenbergiella tayi]|uniref:FtsX-like permease family protein n=2 Tax=Lachnospiraceae TaxID=186803 RepID=A0A6N7WCA9_9FIRM|nr:FtsX-like permease family protein [Eisenbergiella porci]
MCWENSPFRGLSNRTIAGLFLYENLMIAGMAFVFGLLAGILLSRLVKAAVLRMFGMTFTLGFSVSFQTAGVTLLYFAGMYLFALHKNKRRLRKISCMICCITIGRTKAGFVP